MVFKKYDQGQTFLTAWNPADFVPLDHPARTLNEVFDHLDLSLFYEKYHARGASSYDPLMMIKVLFYGYNTGVTSSRDIADHLNTHTVYMYLSGMQSPDFRTICRFRTLHREGIEQVFVDIVQLCVGLGMVGLGNVSFDGTRIKANASGRRTKDLKAIEERQKKLVEESVLIDKLEDEAFGEESPHQMPPGLRNPVERRRRIREELEKLGEAKKRLSVSGEKSTNLTDPDARLMKTRRGVVPGYNGGTAVDGREQVILAARLVKDENDTRQLVPLIEDVERNVGRTPVISTGDSGLYSLDNLEYLVERGLFALIPDNMYHLEKKGKTRYYPKSMFKYDEKTDCYTCPGGKVLKHNGAATYNGYRYENYRCREEDCTDCAERAKCTGGRRRAVYRNRREYLVEQMRNRLDTPLGGQIYQERMSIVEPVYGNMKENKGFRQFLLRSLEKTSIEFKIMCTVHNVMKIHEFVKRTRKSIREAVDNLAKTRTKRSATV